MILYRDTTLASLRTPAWLEGCADVQRLITDHGDIVGACDPLFLAQPPDEMWCAIEDGWQIARVGDLELLRILRQRQDLEFISVDDSNGQAWMVPAVLTPDGGTALMLPWGLQDGMRSRKPTPEQKGLIAAASAARTEILAGRIGSVPVDIAAEWVHALLASAYHLPPIAFDVLEIIDDRLAMRVLLAASGFPVQ